MLKGRFTRGGTLGARRTNHAAQSRCNERNGDDHNASSFIPYFNDHRKLDQPYVIGHWNVLPDQRREKLTETSV